MPKRSSTKAPVPAKRPGTAKDHDFATIARNVVEQAIGERLDGSPLLERLWGYSTRLARRASKVERPPFFCERCAVISNALP